eukprot:bmy_20994T0
MMRPSMPTSMASNTRSTSPLARPGTGTCSMSIYTVSWRYPEYDSTLLLQRAVLPV